MNLLRAVSHTEQELLRSNNLIAPSRPSGGGELPPKGLHLCPASKRRKFKNEQSEENLAAARSVRPKGVSGVGMLAVRPRAPAAFKRPLPC